MKFFLNPLVRGIIICGSSIAITILVANISWDNPFSDSIAIFIFCVLALFILINLTFSIIYLINDYKEKRELAKVEKLKTSLNAVKNIIQASTPSLDKMRCELKNTGNLNFNIWGFELECQSVCQTIVNLLTQGNSDKEISVYCTKKENAKTFRMIAGSSTYSKEPERFRNPVSYKVAKDYYYVRSFDKKDILILTGKDEIQKNFLFKDETTPCVYKQYISIPIYDAEKNVTTRIEIITYNDTIVDENAKTLKQSINRYIDPLINWLSLVDQIQASLCVETPSRNKKENTDEKAKAA